MENSHKWCYVSGRVNVLESSLVGDDFFMRIIASSTLEEVHRIMGDYPAKAYFTHADSLYDTDSMLNRYYKDRLTDISDSSPDQAVCNLFRLRYDFLNLKNYIKEKILLMPYERHPLGMTPDDLWKGLWEGDKESLPEIFESSVTILKENIGNGASVGVVIDSIIDNAYLCHLLLTAKEIGSPMIENFFQKYQLVKGTEIVWRALLSGSEAGLIPEFLFITAGLKEKDLFFRLTHFPMDKWHQVLIDFFSKELCEKIFAGPPKDRLKRFISQMDDYLFKETQPQTYISFGPEMVFLYLIGFTREVFNLGLVIKGRLTRIPPPLIEERLRKIYV